MNSRYEVLSNGTEVLLANSNNQRVVSLQVWVKSGSMDEGADESGMAHFVEHMLFKGTKNTKVGEFGRLIESCGGSIGAYTDYDRTVLHLTIMDAYLDLGLELLFDATYNSALHVTEIELEKPVVCEEINTYADDPTSVVREETIRLAFQDKVLPILGRNAETVRAYNEESLRAFYRRHYVPANMAIVAAGAFAFEEILAKINASFGKVAYQPAPVHTQAKLPFTSGLQSKIFRGDYQVPRLQIALPAPTKEEIDAVSFEVSAHLLGAGECSRLHRSLRDEQSLVSALSVSYASVPAWGMLEITLLTSVEKLLPTLSALRANLHAYLTQEQATADEIKRAEINACADLAQQTDTVEGIAENFGNGLLTAQKYLHSDYCLALLAATTPDLVQQTMQRCLTLEQAVIVCALPQEAQLEEKQLLAAYQQTKQVDRRPSLQTRSRSPKPENTCALLHLDNGIDFIYQRRPTSQLCDMMVVTRGGLLAEQETNNGLFNAIACMLGQANGIYSHQRLQLEIENRGALLGGFSGKDSLGMQLQCLRSDIAFFCKLLAACLLEPVFPNKQWQVVEREINDLIRLQAESPAYVCMQHWQEKIFPQHPYRFPLTGALLQGVTAEQLLVSYQQHAKQTRWVISASADLPAEEMFIHVNTSFSALQSAKTETPLPKQRKLRKSATCFFPMEREQCHIINGFRGLTWHDRDRAVLDVVTSILDGLGGRLFLQLRDKQGLVYSVSPLLYYGLAGGAFGAHIACAPNKAEQVCAAMCAELQWQKEASEEEITRAKRYIIGNYYLEMESGEKQVMHRGMMHLLGVGYDEDYLNKVSVVQKRDVDRVIAEHLLQRPSVTVIVGSSTKVVT